MITPSLFSLKGDVGRKPFLVIWFAILVVQYALFSVPVLGLAGLPVFGLIVLGLLIKRLRHIGCSGRLALIPAVAFVIYFMAFVWFGFTTERCCGLGVSDPAFEDLVFHALSDQFNTVLIAMFVLITAIGAWPGKQVSS